MTVHQFYCGMVDKDWSECIFNVMKVRKVKNFTYETVLSFSMGLVL